jgi:hypothetical protein
VRNGPLVFQIRNPEIKSKRRQALKCTKLKLLSVHTDDALRCEAIENQYGFKTKRRATVSICMYVCMYVCMFVFRCDVLIDTFLFIDTTRMYRYLLLRVSGQFYYSPFACL